MRTIFLIRSASAPPKGPWSTLMRLAAGLVATVALLILVLVGFVVILPLALIGGIILYVYLRRRKPPARPEPKDGVIEAEYTVIERHD